MCHFPISVPGQASEVRELEMIRNHRASNIQKRQTDGKKGKYCLCQQRLRGHMLQCELCCDFFHSELGWKI